MPSSDRPTRPSDPALSPSAATRGRTVLLVEDDAEHRFIYSRVLSAAGYEVVEARTGPGALEQAARQVPDVVILDIGLPGLDGWEVTRRLKAMPALRDVPVIAVTVHTFPGDREQSLASGCAVHLDKPARPTEVLAAVDQVLGVVRDRAD